MSWQVLNITKPGKLWLKNAQCIYSIDEGEEVSFALDNISVIVLESAYVSVTSSLLKRIAENNIVLFICPDTHTPCGIYYPFMQYFSYSKTANMQKEWTVPFKNRIWQIIVKNKINNQAAVLESNFKDGAEKLRFIARGAETGDDANAEGVAAAQYWKFLFGQDFVRDSANHINAALNYGYSLLRGAITRSLAASGFVPCFGLHHNNYLNAFNLADDIIEPFRPIVDAKVLLMREQGLLEEGLLPSVKPELLKILLGTVYFNKENVGVLTACDYSCQSLSKATAEKDYRLFKTPEL